MTTKLSLENANELRMLSGLLEELVSNDLVDSWDTEEFSTLMRDCVELIPIPIKSLTEKFGISRSTAQRWASMRSEPRTKMLPVIKDFLIQKVLEKISKIAEEIS